MNKLIRKVNMHEGKIVHFEDNDNLRDSIAAGLYIRDSQHQIVDEAADLPTALGVLEQIQNGELDANVVLLDGNLSDAVTGSDARAITSRIQELGLPVRVIGLSSSPMEKYGVQVDFDLTKENYSADKLLQVLDDLEEPKVES